MVVVVVVIVMVVVVVVLLITVLRAFIRFCLEGRRAFRLLGAESGHSCLPKRPPGDRAPASL